ncbi:DHA2 family efflux MFS transporter permease subunit [Glycomyces sp. NPDC047010]|uniref:DHA2 family efflux MFS transporter permease subunit n=1 Tax=Glycomyces sp. NPDC047010 TaxID=3155023 RepID=UPI00340C24B4
MNSLEPSTTPPRTRPRANVALAVLVSAQLLLNIDATIVNVALPAMRAELGLTAASLQWVVTGYLLAFGGLLLLGGRLADRLGRRRVFLVGMAVFAIGSAVAGLAQAGPALITGRVLQGIASAALSPAALALVVTLFPAGRERDRAFGFWGAASAAGTALGLVLGGVLTQFLSWQWIFWVNLPLAAVIILVGRRVLPEHRETITVRLDLTGAILATSGLATALYGVVTVAESGWSSAPAVTALVVGAALLAGFAHSQWTRPEPLVPARLLRQRAFLGANLVGATVCVAINAAYFFVTLFLSEVLRYGPLAIGLAFLPLALAVAVSSHFTARWIGRTGARTLLLASTVLIAAGMGLLTQIDPDQGYAVVVLPALLVLGLGLGIALVALTASAVGGAPAEDSGVAAAVFSTSLQVGGAVGLALLTAVSTAVSGPEAAVGGAAALQAQTGGWTTGFAIAAATMILGLVITLLTIPRKPLMQVTTCA